MSKKSVQHAITADSTIVSLDRFLRIAFIRLLIAGYLLPSWFSLAPIPSNISRWPVSVLSDACACSITSSIALEELSIRLRSRSALPGWPWPPRKSMLLVMPVEPLSNSWCRISTVTVDRVLRNSCVNSIRMSLCRARVCMRATAPPLFTNPPIASLRSESRSSKPSISIALELIMSPLWDSPRRLADSLEEALPLPILLNAASF
mmetsp:Transcript_40692/g.68123  ORF Transcript_40692/g.68123 Transcript_40692/m.68123 type:complete len:205 (+) Transcript_40692:567-1181(+)